MFRRIVILTIMLCLSLTAKSQDDADEEDYADPVVDSLLREYNAATSDTARMRLCREIGEESDDTDTIIKYSKIGISLYDGKDSLNLAYCNAYLGWAYYYSDQLALSIDHYKKATELFKVLGMSAPHVMFSVNLSLAYGDAGEYRKLWQTLYDALDMARQNADTINMCYCYIQIIDYYDDYDMKRLGVETAEKALRLASQANEYTDMGLIASLMANHVHIKDSTNTYRKSIAWLHRALEYFDKAGDLSTYYTRQKGNAYLNLTARYLELAEIEDNPALIDSAEFYIEQRTELFTNIAGEETAGKILNEDNRALVKLARHDYHGALKQLLNTLQYTKDVGDSSFNHYLYKDLSKTYDKLGDYRNALKYHKLYRKEEEPINNAQAMMEAAAFEVRSQVEQEQEVAEYEKQIAEKELEQERQHFRRMTYVSAAGGVAALAFVFFLLRMLHHTRKSNATLISHNEEIKAQNEELDTEKDNLLAINDKIRQSMRYARRIQMATVSSEAEIEEVFPGALVYYKPSEIVSGDWYWTSRLGSKRILALGGSAKNGVPGALVSMMTVNALKDTVGQLSAMSSVSPTAILRTVKNKLPESARNNAAGVTLCIFGRGSVRFAGVNQNAILLKNGNSVIMQGDKPGDMFHTVSEGDSVMLYSASTARELNVRGITPESFCQFISPKSHVEQVGAIEEMVSQRTQKDDITIVSIII